ncbi:MAG: 4'-phosphopantetheinyl transferase family protein [Chloroflexaceae bacterium]
MHKEDTQTPAGWWQSPPATSTLTPDRVDVWRVALDQPLPAVQRYAQVLSPDEHTRAARFHFERDQRRFTLARGNLRRILARYLGVEPQTIQFQYNAHKKPGLDATSYPVTPQFNLSHSENLAVYAVTTEHAVGIDIEAIRPIADFVQLVERFFSAQERAMFQSLPDAQRLAAFFAGWVRKEAYIKARGVGLTLPLSQFDVTLNPAEPARLLRIQGDPEAAARWTLRDLAVEPGYAAALAVEGQGWNLACWQAPEW